MGIRQARLLWIISCTIALSECGIVPHFQRRSLGKSPMRTGAYRDAAV